MNLSLFRHEFKVMYKSKKNLLFVLFLSALLVSYCFVILPNDQTTDSFDPEKVIQELEELAAEQAAIEDRGATGFGLYTGLAYYAMNDAYYNLHTKMVTAFEDKDFTRFLHLRSYSVQNHLSNFHEDQIEAFLESPFPGKDRSHHFHKTIMRYQSYLDMDAPISYAMIEQKTALQTLLNIVSSNVIYLILFCAIYFSSDIILRDKDNRTILQGLPLSWFRLMNIKTLAVYLYTVLVLLILIILGIIMISLQNGLGFINIQIPVMIAQRDFSMNDYGTISYFSFMMKVMCLVLIIIYLFIRLNTLLSLIFKNQVIVLMVSTFVLFSESIYFSRRTRELFGIEINKFPQTYFEFGKVVSGDKNFLVNLETITFENGITVLLSTILIIEIVLYVVSRVVNKRRFYK
ncbi:ABC transporter permease subunit [Virgibacillus sp. C22-A2]|uniref:ABC transporter permease subunit n=1 Tax=Virgibacillus tibetensis TaxID=3042313 RepID=A0ABU6KHR3_9BACI|nr:ABC transporter permease subunit [Virgibacillus sp. C22-A2]